MGRLNLLLGCQKERCIPGHPLCPFFPSLLHWPQCLPPPWGVWLCHLPHHEAEARKGSWEHSDRTQGLEITEPCPDVWQKSPPRPGAPGGGRIARLQQDKLQPSPAPLTLQLPSSLRSLGTGKVLCGSTLPPASHPVILYKQPQGARASCERTDRKLMEESQVDATMQKVCTYHW